MAKARKSVATRIGALARKHKISRSSLMKVYRRGVGAAVSSGTRKGMTPSSWGIARVNSFIKIVKGQKRIKLKIDYHNYKIDFDPLLFIR